MSRPQGRSSGRLVRPYAITGGRTRSQSAALAMEALVVAKVEGRARAALTLERRAIAELALTPVSVAEISAHLQVPLGVARVLVGDMAADGLVVVHQPKIDKRPDVVLLERVLNGIRAL
ncbi:MAG TPA: DUF742 domain-containing protein [Acidimicrobiales bacterium]|nr:DUF742 domain-containing protein [Acidimicrobiales bacterium]